MFNSKEVGVRQDSTQSNNILGKGTTFKGNIETFGNIRIEGKVIGDIATQSKAAIGNTAIIDGSVSGKVVEIEGEVKGSVRATDILILKSTARVKGDIHAKRLTVEAGASFDGQCKMGAIPDNKLELNNEADLQKAS